MSDTAMMSYGSGPALTKLSKSNYGEWMVNMGIHIRLRAVKLWSYLDDEYPEAEKPATTITRAENQFLSDLIFPMLTTEAKQMLSKTEYRDGVELWKEIKGIFTVSGKRQYIKLQREQQDLSYTQFGSIHEYRSVWMRLQTAIKNTRVEETEDNKFFIHLLQTLPSEKFSTIMQIWHSQDLESMTSDKAVQMVSDEEKRLEQEQYHESKEEDQAYKFNVKSKKGTSFKANVKCYNCGKKGHYKNECPVLRDEKGGEKTWRDSKRGNTEDKDDKFTKDMAFVFTIQGDAKQPKERSWFVDSGASTHLTCNKSSLQDYTPYPVPRIGVGPTSTFLIEGYGTIVLQCVGDNKRNITVRNVKYAPFAQVNLLSMRNFQGVRWVTEDDVMEGYVGNELVFYAEYKGGQYRLRVEEEKRNAAFAVQVDDRQLLWHSRLGHVNHRTLHKLHELVDGVPKLDAVVSFCEPCTVAKLPRTISRKMSTPATKKLELVHSDVGTMPQPSIGGRKYYVTFTDDMTRYHWTYLMKNKGEVESIFKSWKQKVEHESDYKLQRLRTDGGGEYIPQTLLTMLHDCGIKHEKTPAHTPEMNGVAERFNRTLVEMIKSMLYEAELDDAWWGEAAVTATYLLNIVPTAALENTTPFKEWKGVKPDLKHLRIFGSECWVHVPKIARKKLDNHAIKGKFVGYAQTRNTYRVAVNGKVSVYRDVRFRETPIRMVQMSGAPHEGKSPAFEHSDSDKNVESSDTEDNQHQQEIAAAGGDQRSNHGEETSSDVPEDFLDDERNAIPATAKMREKTVKEKNWQTFPKEAFQDFEPKILEGRTRKSQAKEVQNKYYTFMAFTAPDLPSTYAEAVSGPNKKDWQEAMDTEMSSIQENKTWNEVKNTGQRTVKCKWVYARKASGLFKARLVAKGFTQREGCDYQETFAPVAKVETLRFLLAEVISLGYHLHQMDVVTAFLYGSLKEEIYMTLPEGYDTAGKIARLLKSLYGLKQSPRQWYAKLSAFLLGLGFQRSRADETLYFKNGIWILVYVDDLFIAGELSKIKEVKEQLSLQFKMKDLGRLSLFLGMQLVQRDNYLFLTQRHYLRRILEKYNMDDCNAVTTPVPAGAKLVALQVDKDGNAVGIKDHDAYRTLVGSLLYASTHTRPDIAWAVGLLSRYLQAPGATHWSIAKHLLRYIKGTLDYGLRYQKTAVELFLHSDSDWAGAESRKSTTGYVAILAGSAVTWNSAMQRTVALSSMEAEYVALSEAVKEAQWLMKLVKELYKVQGGNLHSVPNGAPVICSDNNSALIVAKNPEQHKKAKHIDIKHAKVRDEHEAGNIQLARVSSEDNRADIFTKALSRGPHQKGVKMLGVGPMDENSRSSYALA